MSRRLVKCIVWFSASPPRSPDALLCTLKPSDLLIKRGIRFTRCWGFCPTRDGSDLWSHCLLIPINKLAFTRAMCTRCAHSFVLPQSQRASIRLILHGNTKSARKVIKLFMKSLLNVFFLPHFASNYPHNRIDYQFKFLINEYPSRHLQCGDVTY